MKQPLRIFIIAFLLLTSLAASAQTYKWRSLSMGAAGFVSGIVTSKQEQNLIYARTDVGGAYKWNAATSSWVQLLDWVTDNQQGFYGVEALALDPQAPNKLYMLVGISYFDGGKSAILKSDNYGQTFTTVDVTAQFKAHGNGAGRSNGERLVVDPNLGSVLYAGTRANGLWKSTDAGTTWTRLTGLDVTTTNNGNGVCFVYVDPASGTPGNASQTIYVGVSRYSSIAPNFYKSVDGGLTFTAITDGPAAYIPQRAVATSNGDLIINYANGAGPSGNTTVTPTEPMNNGGIYKYNLATGAWTNSTPSGIAKAWGGLAIDPNNPLRMMASTINNYQLQYGPPTGGAYGDRIYLTTNGGATWTDVVTRGFTLNDNGIPWINSQAIHWAGSLEFDPFNTAKVFVTSGNGIFTNDNIDVASTPWKFDVKGLEETVPTAIVSLPGGPLFTTIADYDCFKFTNLNEYGTQPSPTIGSVTGLAYAGLNTNYLVRVGSTRMMFSTDQGITWTQTTGFTGASGKVAVTANGATLLHAPNGQNTIFYSTNNGATWTGALNGAGPALFGLASAIPVADMVNPSYVYLYNPGSGNFSRSTTGGTSFTVVGGIGTNGSKLMRTIPGLEGHIWIPMYGGGLRRSTNAGTTFTTITGVTACSAVGYGKAAPGATYLTLYIWGTVGGVTGIFRSIDEGATWLRINTNATQFGGPGNAQAIMGDMNNFGIVYMSTVGRGVAMGYDPLITPLPVTLNAFTVKATEQSGSRYASLTWKTTSEANLDYFAIERSTDARQWSRVGTVASRAINGNSSTPLMYDYADDISGRKEIIYYRLKLVDRDGRFSYSSIGQVKPLGVKNEFSIAMLSNPISKKQTPVIRLISEAPQQVVVTVVSPAGSIVLQRNLSLSAGSTNISLTEAANLSSGMYLLKATGSDGLQATSKFIVQ